MKPILHKRFCKSFDGERFAKSFLRNTALWTVLIICFMSCGKGPELAGKYEAVSKERGGIIALELKSDGSGVWMFDGDEAFFKWEAKDGNVWLHTKDGGVIIGHVERDAIRITLPGMGEFVFKPK